MNRYRELLYNASKEVITYFEENEHKLQQEKSVWKNLSLKMQLASELTDQKKIETEIHSIARMIIDGFPVTEEISKSFEVAIGVVQQIEKNRKKG